MHFNELPAVSFRGKSQAGFCALPANILAKIPSMSYYLHRNLNKGGVDTLNAFPNIKVPVGRSGFADIRKNGYYYVDKSGLVGELLRTEGIQAVLITRFRRFGKTLALSFRTVDGLRFENACMMLAGGYYRLSPDR